MKNRRDRIRLDLNNSVFQRHLFALTNEQKLRVLNSLEKISGMEWNQLYRDTGLRWEAITQRQDPHGNRLYSFRLGKAFRAIAFRDGEWLRIVSLHPDHDSAYE
jgi:hypothetical protein